MNYAEPCRECKHFSRLDVWIDGDKEHHVCQAGNCVYCEQMGRVCHDFEQGENDGGKLETDYQEG